MGWWAPVAYCVLIILYSFPAPRSFQGLQIAKTVEIRRCKKDPMTTNHLQSPPITYQSPRKYVSNHLPITFQSSRKSVYRYQRNRLLADASSTCDGYDHYGMTVIMMMKIMVMKMMMMMGARGYDRLRHVLRAAGLFLR